MRLRCPHCGAVGVHPWARSHPDEQKRECVVYRWLSRLAEQRGERDNATLYGCLAATLDQEAADATSDGGARAG